MDKLIDINNKLQDVLAGLDRNQVGNTIDLPQIVVIGTQSAGKSSVLESFVGREFLPRGSGIVTRRPLILRLVHVLKSTVNGDYAIFGHRPNVKYTDFNAVRKEIEDETDRTTGRNKRISPEPIYLTVYSPNVVDLTLVDLPGIARIPVGDQPQDIERQIKAMIMEFIRPANSIILAVTAANVDIATSDSIQLAKHVDPEGTRTIGVLTKLDLMDKGTDAYDTLTGRFLPLRLGYVGVVCRGQKALNTAQSVADAVAAENNFFRSHPRYRAIADRCGTQYLSRKLNEILVAHIKANVPRIRSNITTLLIEARKECDKYAASPAAYGDVSASAVLLDRIKAFTTSLESLVRGKDAKHSSNKQLVGGALIRHTFTDEYARAMEEVVPLEALEAREISCLMTNMSGIAGTVFTSDSTFEFLTKREIERLEEPSLECVERVYTLLARFASKVEGDALGGYPKLKDFVEVVMTDMMAKNRDNTKEMVRNIIRIERSYINKSHPLFLKYFEDDKGDKKKTAGTASSSSSKQSSRTIVASDPFTSDDDPFEIVENDDDDSSSSSSSKSSSKVSPPSGSSRNQVMQNSTKQQQQQQPPQKPSPPQKKTGWWPWSQQSKQAQEPQQQPQQPKPQPPQPPKQQQQQQQRSLQPVQQQSASLDQYGKKSKGGLNGSIIIDRSSSMNKKDRQTADMMRDLVTTYFEIVKKNVKDSVPKAIMLFLVNKTVDSISPVLINMVLKNSETIEELVTEDSGVVAQRKAAIQKRDTLEKALTVLNEVQFM